ncbi:Ni-Fe hydrogenase, membrane subunit HycD/HyfD [Thermocrinis albus DSM 14484]|uniref:Ni-Fe hydrogenase, membrane subunit HycD/HyfD n=1 Tax=Thermocrinis albus (strain DSM 14484 / JCM 11386 / HI 11/12) TaxID=638303 RepID=D3SMS0_THEAH|nr:NADH-quinone oxidoreductase subunit H [Thermocrinis albus]ADC90050.1 Ni-Fe hydrogenase, membrane subunit HycD/HyfD [Thermocrinis albus DSM 14484]
METVASLLQFLILILIAPLFAGFIHKIKQNLRAQRSIGIFQFYVNLYKLLRKEKVLSKDSSHVSRITPLAYVIPYVLVLAMLPTFYQHTLLQGSANIVLFIYLLTLSTFSMTLFALDQASPFGALGASREWFLSSLAEPTLLTIFVSLSLYTGSWNITDIFLYLSREAANVIRGSIGVASVGIPFLLILTLFILTLAENARIPFDNPETHLELTMIHEANILEASGSHLAMFELGSYLKLTVFLSLLSLLLFPYVADGISEMFFALLFYLTKMFFISITVAFVEVINPKMRLFRIPNVLALAFVLSLTALILALEV